MNFFNRLILLFILWVRLRFCCASTLVPCDRDQFECHIGQCIGMLHVCDGDVNCMDESDETGCKSENPPKCGKTYYQCALSRACIPTLWTCDGEEDCSDGSDERNCTLPLCQDYEFECLKNQECVHQIVFCDGKNDCRDGSDERSCLSMSEYIRVFCGNREFLCEDGHYCVNRKWLCDGELDCFDGSDEKQCDGISSTFTTPASSESTTTEQSCPDNYCMENADCVVVRGQYHCNCSPSFTGEKCEFRVSAERAPLDLGIVIGIAMAAVILLIIAALILLFYRKRRSTRYSTQLMSKSESKMSYTKE